MIEKITQDFINEVQFLDLKLFSLRFKYVRSCFSTNVMFIRIYSSLHWYILYKINKSMALQLRRAKTDWNGCCQITVQGTLRLAKCLSLNLNFSFLNWISLFLISSSYPIVLTRLGGPRSRPYTSRKISEVNYYYYYYYYTSILNG